eukprot:CAMPEP_0196793560 /NCGR_PEP_ID=MMETSP1104-20130614/33159_1 /TAXON_ID=33652 /ORGANISM="Cafeteria sp., Strain Caron Lab Isolate" /LENGTH=75 /DNA_ID=CAMNT_0042163931 /DNA_START=192 /DNA_END=419 /DNA_ORIENTATION=-
MSGTAASKCGSASSRLPASISHAARSHRRCMQRKCEGDEASSLLSVSAKMVTAAARSPELRAARAFRRVLATSSV